MKTSWLLIFLLLQTAATEAVSFSVGGGVGGGTGGGCGDGGGGGSWIGGGINSNPSPSGSSISSTNNAYTALQAWKSAIRDDPLGILSTWVGLNVCYYKGGFCSNPQDDLTTVPVIVGIDLNHANLQRTLVKELSLLREMSLLHLNSNKFTGTVPDTFKDLSSLVELDLSNNQFSGPFSTPTLYILNLLYLDLRFNSLTSSTKDSMQYFSTTITRLQILGNSPASIMNLANNKFSGEIPFSFGYMGPRLKEVMFLNNQLTGCILEGVGLWQDLQVLDVSFNSLVGHLPDSMAPFGRAVRK